MLIALDTVLFGIFRLVFHQWFSVPDATITTPMLLNAFYLGFKFDLKLAILINLPVFILSSFRPLSATKGGAARASWLVYLLIAHALVVFVYFIDFGHYDYLRLRIDVTIIRFLEDLAISNRW